MSPPKLFDRAQEIEAWVEDHFVDANGIVYTYIDTEHEAPLNDAFFAPGQNAMQLPGTENYTPAEWHNYENCGMTTGAYMQGLLHRYAVDSDPQALARARRSFEAIKYIYDLGKQLEEGFFPKVYGNRFSEQTSTDQVLYAMLALDHFHRVATDAEKKEVSHMIAEMIRFWVKRGYRYQYFWHKDMLWPLGRFPSLLLMGYRHSGDALFKKEYDRLLGEGVNEVPVESRMAPKLSGEAPPIPYEEKHQAWLIGDMEGTVSMDIMELCYLLENDPENKWAPMWRKSVKAVWDEGTLVLIPDGTMYRHVLVDMNTGEPRRPEPEAFRESHGAGDWIGHRLVLGDRSGDSTFMARSAMQAQPHVPDAEMVAAAQLILRSLDKPDLRTCFDPGRFPPELQHRTRLYSGDAVANWHWAYWQGRAQNNIASDVSCLPSPIH